MGRSDSRGLRNMTEGSPAAHLFCFALPLLAGSFLQQLYNMVDSWVVGNYVGVSAQAAVGVGFPVMFMFSSLFIGLGNGGTVVIAQFYGGGDRQGVRDAVDTIYTAFLFSAVPIALVAVALVRPLLLILRVEESAFADAQLYLTVMSCGLVGAIGYNLNAGILGGLGNSRTTLLFLVFSSVMNIVLDLVLVIFFHMEVLGAALATIFSQLVSWLFGLFYINRRYPEIAIHPFCRRFDRGLFKEIMRIGLPAGIQMSLIAVGAMVVMSKIDSFGPEQTAAYTVASRLDQMAFLPVQSIATAATSFVGQNVGARRMDRVKQGVRITVTASFLWSVGTLILIPLGTVLMDLFSEDPVVIRAGAVYLKCVMPFYLPFSVMFCLNNAMRGAGDSLFPMVNVVLSLILLRVPSFYYLADHFGPDFMYYGIGLGWTLGCILSLAHYFTGRWKRFLPFQEEKAG